MIGPMFGFAAVSAASSAISSAVKAGKDLHSLSGPVAKYAKAEAELNFGASRKKNSLFSRMTGAEQAGIDSYFKKLELDQMRAQLREVITIHGKPGAWEALQAEIARQRQLQKEELERRAKVRDAIILWTVLPVMIIGGAALLYLFVQYLRNLQ